MPTENIIISIAMRIPPGHASILFFLSFSTILWVLETHHFGPFSAIGTGKNYKGDDLEPNTLICGEICGIRSKFAGPRAQGVLDPLIVPRPMSLGRPGLFVLIKDNAFLGTLAHKSVTLAGYLPATCDFPLCVATKKVLAKR